MEHIDNPKGYGEGEGDPRQFHPKLRPPVNPEELEIDPHTGMKASSMVFLWLDSDPDTCCRIIWPRRTEAGTLPQRTSVAPSERVLNTVVAHVDKQAQIYGRRIVCWAQVSIPWRIC